MEKPRLAFNKYGTFLYYVLQLKRKLNRVAQISDARSGQLNFEWWHQIFAGPQFGT
jgi:hypothetical protein